jgi:ABC-type proline/glycine betaine transport system permease subunit
VKQTIAITALIAFTLGVPVGIWIYQAAMCERLTKIDLLAAYDAVCEDPLQEKKP